MSENLTVIPLAYRYRAVAALLFFFDVAVIAFFAANVWFSVELIQQHEFSMWNFGSIVAGALCSVFFGVNIPDDWRVLRGGPALWLEDGSLILQYMGRRRIPLSRITSVEFDRIATRHYPASMTLHLGDAKPMTVWFFALRPVSGFTDALRNAIAKPA